MRGKYLEEALVRHSAQNSGFDERRGYVGLSGICDCPRVILRRFRDGQTATDEARLKTCLTYEMERALLARLGRICVVIPSREIKAVSVMTPNGSVDVSGHTDGEIVVGNGAVDLLEIGTIPLAEYFPVDGRIPTRKYWQCQAYMHFGGYARTQLIFQARDTGGLRVYEVFPNRSIIAQIEGKIRALTAALRENVDAECLCGRCRTTWGGK